MLATTIILERLESGIARRLNVGIAAMPAAKRWAH